MKKAIFILLVAIGLGACMQKKEKAQPSDSEMSKKEIKMSNKNKVVALLKSIETGDQEPVSYINPKQYIQHDQGVADGLAGFGELMQQLPKGSAKVKIVRVLEDGDYVIAHTAYDFFGPKVGFDIFRFEDGIIVEHWDNLQPIVDKTASGRTQTDGPTKVEDLKKTDENKALVKNFVDDVLFGKNPDKITDYISTNQYDQHNPHVKDGLAGLGEAMKAMTEAGTPMTYDKNHIILGEGNFVLTVSEGIFMKEKVAFYDLFRIENGKIVEHWDAIQNVIPDSEAKNSNGKFGFK